MEQQTGGGGRGEGGGGRQCFTQPRGGLSSLNDLVSAVDSKGRKSADFHNA